MNLEETKNSSKFSNKTPLKENNLKIIRGNMVITLSSPALREKLMLVFVEVNNFILQPTVREKEKKRHEIVRKDIEDILNSSKRECFLKKAPKKGNPIKPTFSKKKQKVSLF